jgi:hypothetical protein
MQSKILILTLVIVVSAGLSAYGQEKQTANTLKLSASDKGGKAQISDMAWLAGTWQGSGLGGVTEEVWSSPQGGIMMGMYRMLKDGKPIFYEFLTLSESDGGLLMRLKHFHANFVGWEEKDKTVDFRFIRKEGNRAYFEGLTWELAGPSDLNVYLAIENKKDGSVRETIFRYKRIK